MRGSTPFAVLAVTAAAFWDSWRWYAARVQTSPEEALALVLTMALVATMGRATARYGPHAQREPIAPDGAALGLALYALAQPTAPQIVSAAIAVTTVLALLHRAMTGARPPPALFGLAALSLPVLPSLQFVLGYPLRIVSAAATVALLEMQGLTVGREGTYLVWQGEALQFDAPCSGVNMLWASLMLTLAACTVWRSGAIMTAAALAAAIVLAVAANVLRAASLFFVETGLIADAPAWWHEAIGIAAFAGSAIASLRVMKRLQQCGLGRQRISPSPAPLVRASGGRLPLTLSWGLLGSAALAAALMPLVAHAPGRAAAVAGFPGWPGEHEGRTLTPLPLTDREAAFVRDFPGRIARFSDGSREIILRWVAEPTRRLHPASDCFRGSGYAITPLPLRRDVSGAAMGCFRATRGGEVMTVCEQIRDGAGTRWSDASSWYWEAMLGRSQGPWWSVVVGAAGGEMPAATASPPRTGSDRGTRAP